MRPNKITALESAGWRVGDVADFLELTDDERQLLDARHEAAAAIRRQRKAAGLSQRQLAGRLHTSQPRVARIEQAASDVSLDQMLRAFVAAGGTVVVSQEETATGGTAAKASPRRRKATRGATIRVKLLAKTQP